MIEYKVASRLDIYSKSSNGTDASCALMSGLRDFVSKASAIFQFLDSLKPDDRILKSFKVTGLCPVLIVCCPR